MYRQRLQRQGRVLYSRSVLPRSLRRTIAQPCLYETADLHEQAITTAAPAAANARTSTRVRATRTDARATTTQPADLGAVRQGTTKAARASPRVGRRTDRARTTAAPVRIRSETTARLRGYAQRATTRAARAVPPADQTTADVPTTVARASACLGEGGLALRAPMPDASARALVGIPTGPAAAMGAMGWTGSAPPGRTMDVIVTDEDSRRWHRLRRPR